MPVVPPKKSLAIKAGHSRSVPSRALVSRAFPGRHREPHHWRRRLVRGAVIAVAAGAILVVAVVAWVSQDLPDPNNLNSRVVAQSTQIYARDGTTLLYEIHGDQRRTVVDLADISKYVKEATISIEDKDFYKHGGVSLRGLLRAIFVDVLSGKKTQGGSTITQQLVKNSILTREKSFVRKVKEIILSYQIEQRFTKDQILKMYFNEIPYGSSNYGIEAAAQAYFGKHAKDLDLPESALLAAIVQAPSYYSPNGIHREDLIARQHLVLDEMVKNGYITPAQADQAKTVDILKRVSPARDRIIAPHFVFTVRDQLVQKYGDLAIERGGLRVITTLDPKLQAMAEKAVADGADKNATRYKATNAALVATDPKTGQVLAMVGSRDFFDTEHDGNFNVATAVRNPGSSFKPVVYLTAFSKGYTPDTILFDLKTNFGPDGSGKDFIPSNYDGREHGPLKMRQTLAGSLNIPAVKTLYLAGLPNVLDQADRLGYSTIDRNKVGLALAIGGGGVKLIEHVAAFAAFADDGVQHPTTMILRIEDENGKVMEQYKNNEVKVADQQAVRNLVDIMSDNNARAFVFGAKSPLILNNRPVAAKTGTTNDWRDGWTLGFTPSLAAGVWVGNNDYSPMRAGSDGVVVAAPIWHDFMEQALNGKPVEKFPKPKPNKATKPVLAGKVAASVPISIDVTTGKQIPDSCLASWPKNLVVKKTIREVHDILYYVNKDDPTGLPPTNPSSDPMFVRWEKPVQDWAKKNNYLATSPGYVDCNSPSGTAGPSLTFVRPVASTTITASSLPVEVSFSSAAQIASVQYSIDGVAVGTATSSPFSDTIDISQVANGFHTLTALATDVSGATASASMTINVLLGGGVPTIYFVYPSAHDTISATSLPINFQATAFDPDGISVVTLLMKNADGSTAVLDTVENPGAQTVSLSCPTLDPGTYNFQLSLKNKKGRVTNSDVVSVKITP